MSMSIFEGSKNMLRWKDFLMAKKCTRAKNYTSKIGQKNMPISLKKVCLLDLDSLLHIFFFKMAIEMSGAEGF